MTSDPDSVKNIGALLRDGVRLTSAEAVAIVQTACNQVSSGAARFLPGHPDDVWITEAGTLLITVSGMAEPPKAAVATLLERLLPPPSDESAQSVPGALRTLPARLRESEGAATTDLADLLLSLSRYAPSNPRELLRQFVTRLPRSSPIEPEPAKIAPTKTIVPTETIVPPETTAVTRTTVPWKTNAATVTTVPRDVADLPLQLRDDSPEPPSDRQVAVRSRSSLIPVSMLLIAASGLLGYRVTSSSREAEPVATDTAPAAPATPRIAERDGPRSSDMTPGDAPRPTPLALPVAEGAFSPSFSGNGTMLFHAGHNASGQLYTTTVDPQGNAATAEPLINDRARNYHPRLSPDGTRLAFDSDREGERAVYVAEPNGERITRVSGRGYAAVPSWSPDGTQLAFIKAESDRAQVWNLWLMDVSTGELERHTSFRSGQVWGASWFPDGRRVAYSHEDRLILRDLQSGADEIFETPVRGRLVRTPAVSPDGRRIVFQVYREGAWMLDLTTGEMRRVLDDVTAEEFAWDPVGQRIAYHSRRDGQWRIWLMSS